MKAAIFLLICGMGLAGCDKTESSQTANPAAPGSSMCSMKFAANIAPNRLPPKFGLPVGHIPSS